MSEETDYEVLYQQLRALVDGNFVNVLFEPLFYSRRREDSLFQKMSRQPLNHLLGET